MRGEHSSDVVPDQRLQRQLVYLNVPENLTRYSSCSSDEKDDIPTRNVPFQLPLDFSTLPTFATVVEMKAEMLEQNVSIIESSSLCLLKKASQERIIVDELDVNSPRDRATSAQKSKSDLIRGRSLMRRTMRARSTSRNAYRSLSRGLPVSRISTMDDGTDDNGVEFGRDIRPEGFHRFRRIPSVQNVKGSPFKMNTKKNEPNQGSSKDDSDSGYESHSLSCTF